MKSISSIRRSFAYIAKMPPAIQGSGGHKQTFAVACKLAEFGIPFSDAWPVFLEYNERCLPPWSERDLRHKLTDAFNKSKAQPVENPTGQRTVSITMPRPKTDPVQECERFLKGFRCSAKCLSDASPIPLPDDWTKGGSLLVSNLFQPDELVNFVTNFKMDDGKAKPDGIGQTILRDKLVRRWQMAMPESEAGGWLRMNPHNGRGVADVNVTAFRFALVESDRIPLELQLSLAAKLPVPIAAILNTGGRSIHCWVRVNQANLDDYRATVSKMLTLLSPFGVDDQNKNPSRMSRIVGVTRQLGALGSGQQKLIYLNANPEPKAIL